MLPGGGWGSSPGQLQASKSKAIHPVLAGTPNPFLTHSLPTEQALSSLHLKDPITRDPGVGGTDRLRGNPESGRDLIGPPALLCQTTFSYREPPQLTVQIPLLSSLSVLPLSAQDSWTSAVSAQAKPEGPVSSTTEWDNGGLKWAVGSVGPVERNALEEQELPR